jgi:hypothetical protein
MSNVKKEENAVDYQEGKVILINSMMGSGPRE